MSPDRADIRERAAALLGALGRLSGTLASIVEAKAWRAIGLYRAELRRAASVFAISLAAAILGCTAIAFVALAVMVAFWPTHPVLASSLIAVGFAILAVAAAALARSRTQVGEAERGAHRIQ